MNALKLKRKKKKQASMATGYLSALDMQGTYIVHIVHSSCSKGTDSANIQRDLQNVAKDLQRAIVKYGE